MKKVMFIMAVAGMFAFAACNNNKADETNDSVVEDTTVVDSADVDAVVEDVVEMNSMVN